MHMYVNGCMRANKNIQWMFKIYINLVSKASMEKGCAENVFFKRISIIRCVAGGLGDDAIYLLIGGI